MLGHCQEVEKQKVNIRAFFNQTTKYTQPFGLSSDCPLCRSEVIPQLVKQYLLPQIESLRIAKPIKAPRLICHHCHPRLPTLTHCCETCAMPIAQGQQTCGACLQHSPTYDKTVAAFHYEPPIGTFIGGFKYNENFASLELLVFYFILAISKRYETMPNHASLIPVPLYPKRLKKRGFNQALEIGKKLSFYSGIKLDNNVVLRSKDTRAQADLNASGRQKNLKNAFEILKPPGEHCIIVDDVMTTGSTANEIACTLKKAGAKRVDVWCVARAFPVD